MEIQLKKGIIEAAVLASLLKEDSYGYKIIQDLRPITEISESTLYPILRRLEQAGSLSIYSAEYNGRLRKYYQITPMGKERLSKFLTDFRQVSEIYQFIKNAWR